MRPLSLASIFAGLTGFVTGLINALFRAIIQSAMPLDGLIVALVPLCSAFGFLTVAWLMVALGLRRTA